MVKLSKKAVTDFQKLVNKKRGVDLSYDEAEKAALYFLEFFKLVYEPLPGDYEKKKGGEKGLNNH